MWAGGGLPGDNEDGAALYFNTNIHGVVSNSDVLLQPINVVHSDIHHLDSDKWRRIQEI